MRRGRTHRLSPERAGRLRRALDRLERRAPPPRRLPPGPGLPPRPHPAPRGGGGRVPPPPPFVRRLDVAGARALLQGFVYRFNVAADVAVLLLGMGRMLERRGSLEAGFLAAREASPTTLHGAL